ncbi:MAG TPA: protein jag [Firmicutes bacterium]|nr:protein jag [Bacillota bacterium]
MSGKIITGRTVEETIAKGLAELGIKRDNANIKIIKEPSAGFLGLLGSKQAEIEIDVKKQPLDFIQDYLLGMLKIMGLKGEVDAYVKEESTLFLDVTGPQMGVLIGRRGQTLAAIQYLLNIIIHREFKNFGGRVVVDVEGYRSRREKTLVRLAKNIAAKVVSTKTDVVLEPMSPQDRRIIHTALQDNPDVTTHSEGENPNRKVVISLK